jgi:hypothetical protein
LRPLLQCCSRINDLHGHGHGRTSGSRINAAHGHDHLGAINGHGLGHGHGRPRGSSRLNAHGSTCSCYSSRRITVIDERLNTINCDLFGERDLGGCFRTPQTILGSLIA